MHTEKKYEVEKAICLNEMNSRYAKIRSPEPMVLDLKDGSLQRLRSFVDSRTDELLPVREKKKGEEIEIIYKSKAMFWRDHPQINVYASMDFRPDKAPYEYVNEYGDRVYNLYKGLEITPEHKPCELFKQHIHRVICSGHDNLYNYFIKLLAHWVQKPTEWTCVPVLRGPPGSGKNIFIDNLGKIFGSHFGSVDKQESVLGRFNNILENKLLLHLDEATFGGDKKFSGSLKYIITSEHYNLEKKGRDIVTRKNFVKLIISSNESFAIPVDVDDRRFVFFDVSGHECGNRKYFHCLNQEIENGAIKGFLKELLEMDIQGFNAKSLPEGPQIFGDDNKDEGMKGFMKYLKSCLLNGRWDLSASAVKESEMTKIRYSHMILFYEEWTKIHKHERMESDTKIGLTLKKCLSGAWYVMKQIRSPNGSRSRYVTFESVQKARESFAEHCKSSVDKMFKFEGEVDEDEMLSDKITVLPTVEDAFKDVHKVADFW